MNVRGLIVFVVFLLFLPEYLLAKPKTLRYSLSTGYFLNNGQSIDENKTQLIGFPIAIKLARGLDSLKLSTQYFRYKKNTENVFQGNGNYYLSAKRLFKLPVNKSIHYMDVKFKIKFPSSKTIEALGNQGYDVKISTAIYMRPFNKNWLVTTVGYKWRQNQLNNTLSISQAYSFKLNGAISSGISVDYEQALQVRREAVLNTLVYLGWKTTQRLKLTIYYIRGLMDKSLISAHGMQMSYIWN